MIAHRLTQSLPIATQRLRIRLSQTDMKSFGEMKSWTSRTSSRTPPAQVSMVHDCGGSLPELKRVRVRRRS